MQLDDETLEMLANLGITQDKIQDLTNRQGLMDDIRHNPSMPEGRQAGNVYVNANPLEFVGDAIRRFRAGRESERIGGEISRGRDEIARGRRQMMAQLLGQGGPGVSASPRPQMQQPPMQSPVRGQPQMSPAPQPAGMPAPGVERPLERAGYGQAPRMGGTPVPPYRVAGAPGAGARPGATPPFMGNRSAAMARMLG